MIHSLFDNAVASIQLGVEDYSLTQTDGKRSLSSIRNIYSGILLLCKEVLLRLSPNESNEILIRRKIKPYLHNDGTVEFRGEGNIDKNEIVERIKSFNLGFTPNFFTQLNELSCIRNNIEHYYTKDPLPKLREAIVSSFYLITDILKYLEISPRSTLGSETWQKIIDISDLFERELVECHTSLNDLAFEPDTVIGAILNSLECTKCESRLVKRIQNKDKNSQEVQLLCIECINEFYLDDDVIVDCLSEFFFEESYLAMTQGGEAPLAHCPECGKESYLVEENICGCCNYSMEEHMCVRCGAGLHPNDVDYHHHNLCSYCGNLLAKDD